MAEILDDVVRGVLRDARGSAAPGDAWREATPRLRGALLQVAADEANRVLASTGQGVTDGMIRALNLLVDEHLAAVVGYADLIDGVVFAEGDLDLVLSDDRAVHVAETEARHMRSGVVATVAALLGEP